MRDLTPILYSVFFGVFIVLLYLVIFAPLWMAILGGLAVSMFGAFKINRMLKSYFAQKNPLDVAKELGKVLVFTFVPPRSLYVFCADKNVVDNTVKLVIKRRGREEKYEFSLTPEQLFTMKFDKKSFEVKKDTKVNVLDALENADHIIYNVEDADKQLFKLEPYNVECLFFVYPTEIITTEQLRVYRLKRVGKEKVKQEVNGEITVVEVDVYSPQPYALSKDNVEEISARHRYGQMATILEQSKELLSGIEKAIGSQIGRGGGGLSILSVLRTNPQLLIFIALLVGALFLLFTLTNGSSAINQGMVSSVAKHLAVKNSTLP
jgi:hypothetical protein